ncbi:MAG TPA: ATP phosphoribosyltransferase [Clostridiales bacterium]|nr:ATP phosphoribosyltransferase [Clostridiales bacterium]
MIRVALPKGRMGDKVYSVFEKIGYGSSGYGGDNRKLVFESDNGGASFILVKPSDVTVYVERGAADLGVVGKDVLMEKSPDVYEILDLGVGKCRMAVAAKNGWRDDPSQPLRVATKYPNVAKSHYAEEGRRIDIIKLNGSIELAPILGMSDVIVDIVETGATLRENDLCVVEEFAESSARLIANKSSYNLASDEMRSLIARLEAEM